MDRSARRLNITFESGHAVRMARLAWLAGVPEGTLARLLLSKAIEESDPGARSIVPVLDGIPGAHEHAIDSLERAREGEAIERDPGDRVADLPQAPGFAEGVHCQ
jgi:hypothetical protein